ncbi:MAG: PD40 domain-containing protein, partial [Acidobacteriia bacterium]|nr:PD40 domain-containing protein [Terriglobia bacterium]
AVTLYSYDTKTKQVKRAVDNSGLDLKSASLGPGAIAYEQFGSLHLYDLKTGKTRPVSVRLAGDLPEMRPRFVNVTKRLSNPGLSPGGARAVFEARGEIVTVPAEKGEARNLTGTTGVFERDPAWSPDGKTIAYFSEESGEYELHVREQSGMGAVKKFKLGDNPAFYTAPRWSPDSKKIAYLDNHLGIWYLDLDTSKPVLVDTDYYVSDRERAPAWSPDNKWLAYPKQLKSHMSAIHLYSLETGKATQVTDGMSDAGRPAFDKDGKYLYFLASTDSGPAMEPDVHAFARVVTRGVYLLVLSGKHASPLAPESDDEKPAEEKKPTEEKKKEEAPPKVEMQVDFDNIGQRILAIPMPARSYSDLFTGKAGVVYVTEDPPRTPGSEPKLTVHRYDLSKRKADAPVSGVRSFQISFNGERMLIQKDGKWIIAAPPAEPATVDTSKGVLKTESFEVRVDPPVEWRQMYREVWRLERDFFYDPNAHGLDLQAAGKRYEPYLENLASRHDLSYLFTEMLGELSVGHLFLGGGDAPEPKKVEIGMLGADYKVENGRYRFANVIHGENWNPDLKAPLTQPGVNIAIGDYLLAVNGIELRGTDNVYSFFEVTSGKAVVLKVGADPAGAGAREVTVVPIADEAKLRKLAWVEANRRKVDQMTNGRVAYIYMPDTGYGGYLSFSRYFFSQVGKEAAIIDDRFNHGGHLATDIIEYLKRPLMSMITTRDGADWAQPLGAIFGPKVMIINEFAGSGGDAMPWYFRRAGVGKLIGKRTWGGLVGMSGVPELMDGGVVTAPSAAIWNPNGQYDVENIGTPPDIEVEQDPKAVRLGRDPQLETAVSVVLEELAKNPAPAMKRPPFPNYHRKKD